MAHQLEVTVQDIEQFKRQNDLLGDEGPSEGVAAVAYPEEIDLRAEDDELIAAELEAAMEAERAKAAEAQEACEAQEAREAHEAGEAHEARETGEAHAAGEEEDAPSARRRRGRRGRRSTPRDAGPLEGTFDHGEEGYGLWLDPAVQDNPIYAEHWAGHRPVEVTIEEDQIVIRRTGSED